MLSATSSFRPGSYIWISPALHPAIFVASLSTQTTLWPSSERQAPVTSPTYPVPTTPTCNMPISRPFSSLCLHNPFAQDKMFRHRVARVHDELRALADKPVVDAVVIGGN